MFFHPFKWKATRLLRTLCFITFIACAVVLVVNVTTSLLSSDTTSQKTRSWIHQQPSRFFQTKVPSIHESDRSRQDSSNGSAHSPKEGGRRHVSWKEMTNQSSTCLEKRLESTIPPKNREALFGTHLHSMMTSH